MSAWDVLDAELAAWRSAGARVTLWLRDDDACADSVPLRRLLDLAGAHDVPIALAVIPALLESDLVAAVERAHGVTVVQHGYAHRNHAPADAKRMELGLHRPIEVVLAELAEGRDALARPFGARFAPMLVPPWNRIAPEVVARLSECGFRGLSTFGPRQAARSVAGLAQCNAHVDLVAWHRGRGFVGVEAAVGQLVDHLRARREGSVDADEPTGVLAHHLVLDEDAWRFLAELLGRTRDSDVVDWLGVGAILAAAR